MMRLSSVVTSGPDHQTDRATVREVAGHPVYRVGTLPGEGIGPSLIDICVNLLGVIEACSPVRFDVRQGGAIGKDAVKAAGTSLTDEVVAFCEDTFAHQGAVLCGPGGARFVYALRRRFDLYCKLVPLIPLASLSGVGVLRPEAVRDVDVLVVRDNIGGLYFGESSLQGDVGERVARMTFDYREQDIARLVGVAADMAAQRRQRLCVVFKPGATGVMSDLWESTAKRVLQGRNLEVSYLEVDNACYQMVARAQHFDVVVTPNMFGDVLADGATVLMASRGVSYSANYGPNGRAVYQTGHGAAHDLAGQDKANPIGQVLSLAMMLHESFGLSDIAHALRSAVDDVLHAGWRTADVMEPHARLVGTREMGEKVAHALHARLMSLARAVA